MYFEERGENSDAPLVFMPGFPDTATSGWGEALPAALLKSRRRLIFLCMPGYENPFPSPLLKKSWGFDFEVIVEMMKGTLDDLKLGKKYGKPFVLVAHDWGAFIAQIYTTRYPEDISKLILCDVGMKRQFQSSWDALTNIFYQVCFAIAYVVSQTMGEFAGELLFKSTLSLGVLHMIGPCPHDVLHIPPENLTVLQCYPYYHLWRRILTKSLPKIGFPTCPLLFMYGLKKNCMFHDDEYLKKIAATDGCSSVGMDAGHWFMIDDANRTVQLVLDFL